MTTIPALGPTQRVPVVEIDEDGTPYFRVPLDDRGENYALIDWRDFDYITQTLGCRAAWCLGRSARGKPRYVRVNVPHVGGQGGGQSLVVRLFPGVGPLERVKFKTSDTLNLRRSNLVVTTMQDGRNLDSGTLMAEAVQKREAARKQEAEERKRLRRSRRENHIWGT